ncbi:MAG: hypothetical protein ACON4H_08635 [Rubripirellula sp.]
MHLEIALNLHTKNPIRKAPPLSPASITLDATQLEDCQGLRLDESQKVSHNPKRRSEFGSGESILNRLLTHLLILCLAFGSVFPQTLGSACVISQSPIRPHVHLNAYTATHGHHHNHHHHGHHHHHSRPNRHDSDGNDLAEKVFSDQHSDQHDSDAIYLGSSDPFLPPSDRNVLESVDVRSDFLPALIGDLAAPEYDLADSVRAHRQADRPLFLLHAALRL